MIIVTVDLISGISESRNRRLATLHIINDGTGSKTRGNYIVQAYGPSGQKGKSGAVKDYPREAVSVLNLVHRALQEAGYTK